MYPGPGRQHTTQHIIAWSCGLGLVAPALPFGGHCLRAAELWRLGVSLETPNSLHLLSYLSSILRGGGHGEQTCVEPRVARNKKLYKKVYFFFVLGPLCSVVCRLRSMSSPVCSLFFYFFICFFVPCFGVSSVLVGITRAPPLDMHGTQRFLFLSLVCKYSAQVFVLL